MAHDMATERPIDLVRVRYVDGEGDEHVLRLEQAADVPFEDGRMRGRSPATATSGTQRAGSPTLSQFSLGMTIVWPNGQARVTLVDYVC